MLTILSSYCTDYANSPWHYREKSDGKDIRYDLNTRMHTSQSKLDQFSMNRFEILQQLSAPLRRFVQYSLPWLDSYQVIIN